MAKLEPHLFVVFGATGDLTLRKLVPAYSHLLSRQGVEGRSWFLGVSRSDLSNDEFREMARQALSTALR